MVDVKISRSDVLAAWSGIRPLVKDPNAKDIKWEDDGVLTPSMDLEIF